METTTYRIKDICNVKSGKRIPKGYDLANNVTPYKYIRARDIKNGKISLDDVAYIDETVKSLIKKYIIQKDDIAVTIVANIGDVGICSDDCDNANLTENAVRLTNFDKSVVFPQFLNYYLSQPFMKGYMESLAVGAAQAKLGIYKIEKMKLSLPDLDSQKRIVKVILKYDELIELNNKRIKLLEQTAEELYKEWFVRFRFPNYQNTEFENGIPNNWIVGRINDIVNIYDKKRIPLSSMVRDGMEKLYPYYGAAEMLDYVDDYIFDGKYLLLGEDGSVVTPEGYPVLQMVYGKFWVNNHAHILQGKDGFSTELLYLTFKKMNVNGIVTGSAQPKISQARFLNKHILIPDHKLLSLFNGIIQPIFDKRKSLFDANDNLIKQRDLLLPRLMSGKLEV